MTSLWRFAVKGSVHKDYTSPLLQRKKYTFKAILVSFIKEIELKNFSLESFSVVSGLNFLHFHCIGEATEISDSLLIDKKE